MLPDVPKPRPDDPDAVDFFSTAAAACIQREPPEEEAFPPLPPPLPLPSTPPPPPPPPPIGCFVLSPLLSAQLLSLPDLMPLRLPTRDRRPRRLLSYSAPVSKPPGGDEPADGAGGWEWGGGGKRSASAASAATAAVSIAAGTVAPAAPAAAASPLRPSKILEDTTGAREAAVVPRARSAASSGLAKGVDGEGVGEGDGRADIQSDVEECRWSSRGAVFKLPQGGFAAGSTRMYLGRSGLWGGGVAGRKEGHPWGTFSSKNSRARGRSRLNGENART